MNRVRFYHSIWLLLLFPILSHSVNAQPQTFEFSYGSSTCTERGFKGVEPVNDCSGGGYIAVGITTQQPPPDLNRPCPAIACSAQDHDDNVYVVRTNANGTPIWERIYDVGSFGGYDEAKVIRELPNGDGYIIAGTTRRNVATATSDIFLLKIDCDGNPLPLPSGTGFTQIYGFNDGVNDYVSDLIIATTGDGINTNAGDFVIAGYSQRPFPNMYDGVLIRTRPDGTIIWNKTYNMLGTDPDQHDDYFNTLIEDQTVAGGTGDIVAAGYTNSFVNSHGIQGLVVRVNGNTGNIGPMPQGAAHYGNALRDEKFEAVEELVSNPEWGNLVFAGSTVALGVVDIYLVKTAANPCQLLVQTTVDQAAGLGEGAFGIMQVVGTVGIPFCPIGHLAVVGRTTIACPNPGAGDPAGHEDALLLHVNPFTLTAVAGKHFGSQMGCLRNEDFYSVMETGNADPGFILCGSTADNPGIFPPPPPLPDPSNLYIVKTDGNGETECAEDWSFSQWHPEWEGSCVLATTRSPFRDYIVITTYTCPDEYEDVCPSDMPNSISPGYGLGIGGLDFLESGSLSLPLSGKSEPAAGSETGKTGTIRARVKVKE